MQIISCFPDEFSISIESKAKKNITNENCTSGGFFWGFNKNGSYVTYPVTHLKAKVGSVSNTEIELLKSMGVISNDKYTHDEKKYPNGEQFLNKNISTFWLSGNNFGIKDCVSLDELGEIDYAIGGIPVLLNGKDVSFYNYVKKQGWNGNELYATYHIFIGLKPGPEPIHIICWKSTSSNLIYSAEAFKKFSAMGYTDVLKLDGGGSCIFKANGSIKATTSENRTINNFIVINPKMKTSWEKATAKGIFDGARKSDPITREEVSIVLDRLGLLN